MLRFASRPGPAVGSLFRRATLATEAKAAAGVRPIFENPFANDHLEKATLVLHAPERIRLMGSQARKAFTRLSGEQSAAATGSQIASVRGSDAWMLFVPGADSASGLDALEVILGASVDKVALGRRISEIGPDFAVVDREMWTKRLFEQEGGLDVLEFPNVAALMSLPSESARREMLRHMGIGVSVLYQAWKSELRNIRSVAGATMLSQADSTELQRTVSDFVQLRMKAIKANMQQHISDNRRADLLPRSIHASIFGSAGVGKSAVMQLIAQNGVSGAGKTIVDAKVNIDGLPVVLSDTVALSASTLAQDMAETMKRIDSADLKICVLDMDDIYHDKSSSTIDPAVLDAIDSDTIVLINKSDLVSIRIPEPPAKIRYKNTPLGPQGSDVKRIAFRGRVPLRTDGDTSGNTVQHGDFGLRMLEDVRLTDRCLQECRATLHRHIKNIKGARFWLRIYPTHPMSKKPIGVRMGKGKGSFDHWEAKVPANKILWEIGGGVTEDAAREIFRIVNARLPGKTEVVVAPREERVEELSERICQYTKVPPLGVWCISTQTGEGVDAFMQSFSALLRQRYGEVPSDMKFAPTSKRIENLAKCVEESMNVPRMETIDAAVGALQTLIDSDAVDNAKKYLYHSQFGILKKNQEQLVDNTK